MGSPPGHRTLAATLQRAFALHLVAGAVRDNAERGMRDAIRYGLARWTRPKVVGRIGFVSGATILVVGYGVRRRGKRLKRIEERLADVAEEVVDDDH